MPRSKSKLKSGTTTVPDEWWTIVQVASYLAIPYQTARNRMLEGRFGESQYDAKTRRLTVQAARVLDAKSHMKSRTKTRSRRRA